MFCIVIWCTSEPIVLYITEKAVCTSEFEHFCGNDGAVPDPAQLPCDSVCEVFVGSSQGIHGPSVLSACGERTETATDCS